MVKPIAMAWALMLALSGYSFADDTVRQLTLNAEAAASPIRFVAKRGFVGQIELPAGEAILNLGALQQLCPVIPQAGKSLGIKESATYF